MSQTNIQAFDRGAAAPAALDEARRDLAAALRWAARMGFNEGVVNHFSLAVSPDGRQFLINPYGRHFSRLKASDLVLVDAEDPGDLVASRGIDPTAWSIHGAVHRKLPRARCLLHTHMTYATVLSALMDARVLPIDQNSARFYGRVAIDEGFQGMALDEGEGERLAAALGGKSVLVMGNHGVLVTGASVARAFDDLYYFEAACKVLVTAYATGKELRIMPAEVARRTADDWATYPDLSERHFAELRAILDAEEPDYRD